MIDPDAATTGMPRYARALGFAGLLPQIAVLLALTAGRTEWHFTALALGYAYPATILSFLGGMWWGLAAQARRQPPAWIWFAAVCPSLIAVASAIPWSTGEPWPGPSLGLLGIALIGSLAVDRKLRTLCLCPAWWMGLRIPLSIGLGGMTLAVSAFA